MTRLAAWICIALLSVYLVFFGGGWAGIYRADLRLASVLLAGLVGLVWTITAWRVPFWRPRSAILPALLVALGSMVVSTVASRSPRQSIEYLAYAVILVALYLLLVRILAHPFFRARMGPLTVAFALILGLAFATANIVRWIDWWSIVGRITIPPLRPTSESLTFGNPSTALTIVLLFSIAAVAVVGFRGHAARAAVGAIAVLAAFSALVSGSRAGWIAIGITLIAIGAFAVASPARRRAARRLAQVWTRDVRVRIGLAATAVVASGVVIVLAPTILSRVTEGGADLRLNFVLAAGRMFSESPIVGTGPGTWVIERIRFTVAPETDYYIPHAHNLYAQTASELGMVGILAGLFLLVFIATLIRSATRDPDPVRRRWGWAAALGLVYFGAHQLLDFYANMPAILFAAAIPVAWLDAGTSSPLTLRRWTTPSYLARIPQLVAIACFAVACGGLVISERVAVTEARAVDLANSGEWVAADGPAREAAASDPDVAPYLLTMGLAAANLGDHQRAAAAFRSVAESDDLPEAWLDLAAEETLLGKDPAAGVALDRAARLGLQRPALAMAIGDLSLRLNDEGLALEAFARAVMLVPSLAGDPWWHQDPARASLFRSVVDRAIADAGAASGWEIALMAGDPARAKGLLAAADLVDGVLVPDDVVDAWTGSDTAYRRILAACDLNPLDPQALGWAARLSARRGDISSADRYLRWAFVVSSAAVEAGTELRVSDHPMLGRTARGDVAEFWGAYTYRRFTPWNVLAPAVVQLSIR